MTHVGPLFAQALIVVVAAMAATGAVALAAVQQPPVLLAGCWFGVAHIESDWTAARVVDIRLDVTLDGTASGRVGQSELRGARLSPGRGVLGRWFNRGTDWAVRSDLVGALIPSEGVRPRGISILMNWVNGHFEGGFQTSAQQQDGRVAKVLSAGHMRLDRLCMADGQSRSW